MGNVNSLQDIVGADERDKGLSEVPDTLNRQENEANWKEGDVECDCGGECHVVFHHVNILEVVVGKVNAYRLLQYTARSSAASTTTVCHMCVLFVCCLKTIAEFDKSFSVPFINPEMPCETSFEPEFQFFVRYHGSIVGSESGQGNLIQ